MAKNNNDKQNLSKNLKKELTNLFQGLEDETNKEEEVKETSKDSFVKHSTNKYKSKSKFDPFTIPEVDDNGLYSMQSIEKLLKQNVKEFHKQFDKEIVDDDRDWSDQEFGDILSLYLSRCWFYGLKSFLSNDKNFDILDITPVVCIYPKLKKLGLATLMDVRILFDETMDCMHAKITFDENTVLNYSEVKQTATPAIYFLEFKKYCENFYEIIPVNKDVLFYLPGEVVFLKDDRETIIKNLKSILKTETIY